MLHRRCQDRIAALETELRTTRDRIADRDIENAKLYSRADREESARWDAAGEAELLREKLAAAADREADLEREIFELQCRINDLEQDAEDRRAVLETRRRRAAEHALGGAWDGPGHDSSPGRALVAQALMALPVESYDVEVAYVYDDAARGWSWQVDGKPVNTNTGFVPTSEVDVLIGRYGLTHEELDSLCHQAKRARHATA